ncbi:hypothetical protein [Streptomyces goshikiensis]|uniref:hypothetical protein n=1 Tax=Streptomyces goshikiensis TaxID=1942 RepID=UPI0036BF8EE9
MADSDNARDRPERQQVQVIVSDLVPDGCAMIPIQMADRTVIAVHPAAPIPQLVDALQAHAEHSLAVGFAFPYNAPTELRPHPQM